MRDNTPIQYTDQYTDAGRPELEVSMSWREASARIIHKVMAETGSDNVPLLKQRLRNAYPWGQYAANYYPTRIWRDEIKRQLGLKPPLQHGGRRPEPVPAEQGRLFAIEVSMEQVPTIGEQLPTEIARVKTLIDAYKSSGPAGALAARRIEQAIGRAEQAQRSGYSVALYNAYQELKDIV